GLGLILSLSHRNLLPPPFLPALSRSLAMKGGGESREREERARRAASRGIPRYSAAARMKRPTRAQSGGGLDPAAGGRLGVPAMGRAVLESSGWDPAAGGTVSKSGRLKKK
ncbi:unnamed protein product, partial [Urochloa humidicola]